MKTILSDPAANMNVLGDAITSEAERQATRLIQQAYRRGWWHACGFITCAAIATEILRSIL